MRTDNIKATLAGTLKTVLALLMAAVLTTACTDTGEPEGNDGGTPAMLTLRVAPADGTRAVGQGGDIEAMHSLRIVILHPDGTVEHNALVDFGNAPANDYFKFFAVKGGETKKVFLIANEESVNSLTTTLNGYAGRGASTDFETTMNGLAFTPDMTQPIPMTSVYEVDPIVAGTRKEMDMYVVRAAVKFTFSFVNTHNSDITVNSIQLSKMPQEYLMAHVNTAQQTMGFDNDGDGTADESLYWVDWLHKVSEESEQNPADYTLADKRGWITDYEIPSNMTRTTETVSTNLTVTTDGTADYATPIYLPEDKSPKTGATDGEQEYSVTFSMTSGGETKTKTATLPNLKALFRNTHVEVKVTIRDLTDIQMALKVVPWKESNVEIPYFQ